MNSANKAAKIAVCGIITALSMVVMIVAGFFGVLTYAAPMVAGGLLIIPVREYGTKLSLTVFAAVSLLSLMLVTDKEAAIFYLLFFGYYPIILPRLNQINKKWLRVILKAVIFNAGSILSVWLAQIIFGIPIFEEEGAIWVLVLIYLAAANFCFVLYDKALREFYTLYDIKGRSFLNKIFK